METSIVSLYAQLFGLGLLWVTVHCGGMCGPLMAGLSATAPSSKLGDRVGGVLAYQSGRAVTYMILGALAGGLGAVLESTIREVAQVAGLVVAAVLIVAALVKLRGLSLSSASGASWVSRWIPRAMRALSRRGPKRWAPRMWCAGLVLGLLPCMLMFWALGLAASSASMLHGAGLMLGLVALTTPVLLAAGCASAISGNALRRHGDRVVALAMLGSGLWLGLIAGAANDWIPHVHLPFTLMGHELVFMLW